MDKRHFKEIFKEFNFGKTITIHKGSAFYVGCINGWRVTKFYDNFDECLNDTRDMLDKKGWW